MINLQKMMPKVRRGVESLFDDTCTIYTYEQIKDAETGVTQQQKIIYAENIPCRISFSSFPNTDNGEQAIIRQGIKLFINPEIKILAGSFITITRQGIATDYACTGQPAIYKTHQEINLELYEEYA